MPEPRPSRPVITVLTAVFGVSVLTAFAALVPVEARKLVLFSVMFGLCAGGIVIGAAREFGLARRWSVCLTIPLVLAGLCLIAAQGLHQLRTERAAAAKADSKQTVALSILEAAAEHDSQLAEELAERQRKWNPSFSNYLALRVRPLGEWQQPWPIVFWGVELILAAGAGAVVVSRMRRSRNQAETLRGFQSTRVTRVD